MEYIATVIISVVALIVAGIAGYLIFRYVLKGNDDNEINKNTGRTVVA